MKLEQSFDVSAPVEQVWKALIDIERVAPCLPGASITGRNDDGSYTGAFTIKIGPTTASYTGKLEMQNVDEFAHTAVMQAQGNDRRGQGGANATIASKLTEVDGGTRVEVDTDYHITGRLARFGRGGMIEDISERLLREFAKRLQESLAGQPAEEAAPEPATAVHAVEPEAPAEPEPATAVHAVEPEAPAEPVAEAAPEPEPPAEQEAEPEPEPEAAAEPEAAPPPPPPPPPPPAAPEPPKPPPIEPAEPLDAGSLVGSVVWERVQRNPAPFVGVLAFVLTILLLRRRRRD